MPPGAVEANDGVGAWRRERQRVRTKKPITKIAFGSCTTYYMYPQPIWTDAIIPSEPEAWIWTGDFAYLDSAFVNCREAPDSPQCNCDMKLVTFPPYDCLAGNVTHGHARVRSQLMDYDYQQFLNYMCPDFESSFELAPYGAECHKPIIGTYDDHDFGANDGNRHLEHKYEYKNMFLDALGEPQDSTRRSSVHGLQYKYTFNADGPLDKQIDIFVLDQRYERDSLPCGMRREWCETVLKDKADEPDHDYIWCEDFLNSGGPFGVGSCCHADDQWAYGWCEDNPDSDDPLWDIACDPSSERFGSMVLEVDEESKKLKRKTTYDDFSVMTEASNFCELLGPKQRNWLQKGLQKSRAPLKLVVSGSVLFGNPTDEGWRGACSGDDTDCYPIAQANLQNIVGSVEDGCVVVLTGDYHVSDLKLVKPKSGEEYSKYYPTDSFAKPVYQAMSSGMTPTTARVPYSPDPCQGWTVDTVGMRPYGECSFVVGSSFGMMEIDWDSKQVTLQLLSGEDGAITDAVDGSKQELTFDLNTCNML